MFNFHISIWSLSIYLSLICLSAFIVYYSYGHDDFWRSCFRFFLSHELFVYWHKLLAIYRDRIYQCEICCLLYYSQKCTWTKNILNMPLFLGCLWISYCVDYRYLMGSFHIYIYIYIYICVCQWVNMITLYATSLI